MKQGISRIAGASLLLLLCTMAHAGTVTYVYSDPQGTPLAEADAQGNITATFDYRPYGTQALGQPPNGPGYTGHVNDPDTGFVYMQARYYDPEVGRFLSVDPVGADPGNSFNFGRYTYVKDNPIVNVDPTGMHTASEGDDVCMGNFECMGRGGNGPGRSRTVPFVGTNSGPAPSKAELAKEDKTPKHLTIAGHYRDADCYECYVVWVYQLTNEAGFPLAGDGYAVKEHIQYVEGRNLERLTSEDRFVPLRNGFGYDVVGLTPGAYAGLAENESFRSVFRQTYSATYNGIETPLSTVMIHVITVSRGHVDGTSKITTP